MVAQNAVSEKGVVRFGIQDEGVVTKLFNYFSQPDGSLGVSTYFNIGRTVSKHFLDAFEENTGHNKAHFKVNQDELVQSFQEFQHQKTSFHISGIVVSKDKTGNRLFGDADMKSIRFGNIVDTVQLRVVHISYLDNYQAAKATEVVNTVEPDNWPLMVKLFLSKKEFPFLDWIAPKHPTSTVFLDKFSLARFNLDIHTLFIKSNNNFVPKGEVIADIQF